jgi:hypothetical protein
MSKNLGRLKDTKMNTSLKLYHKINSAGGSGRLQGAQPHPFTPSTHILGQHWADFEDDYKDDFETRFWDDFGDDLSTILRQFCDNSKTILGTIWKQFWDDLERILGSILRQF